MPRNPPYPESPVIPGVNLWILRHLPPPKRSLRKVAAQTKQQAEDGKGLDQSTIWRYERNEGYQQHGLRLLARVYATDWDTLHMSPHRLLERFLTPEQALRLQLYLVSLAKVHHVATRHPQYRDLPREGQLELIAYAVDLATPTRRIRRRTSRR